MSEKQITLDEAVKILCKELNYPAPRAMAFVRNFDYNGDGHLSVSEFEQFKKKIEESRNLLKSTFEKFDADHNGFVSLDEATIVLKDKPFQFPPEVISKLLAAFDQDRNGKLDYNEFAGFYAEAKASNEEISNRFDQLDVDGNGSLSPEEVSAILKERGLDSKRAADLVKAFDTNQDGQLDKSEFMAMWSEMFGKKTC